MRPALRRPLPAAPDRPVPGLCSWQALGTSAVLALTDGRLLAPARAAVERELSRIDKACSRFRPDSDLARVNRAEGRTVKVGPLLIEALEVGLRAARLTDGDVDPTLGVALELAGYDRDWKLIGQTLRATGEAVGAPTEAPRVRAIVRAGWQGVRYDRARCTIQLPRGVKLDLGATAKAWAADRASAAAHAASGVGVLVSLGGDVSVCGPAPRRGWEIHVTDDHRAGPDAPGQRVFVRDGGLATSSVTARRWLHWGQPMHHVIDPATGAPTRGPWRTASVAARDCADANIATTAALVRGDGAPGWLERCGLPARLVSHAGEVWTVGSWPAPAERLAA